MIDESLQAHNDFKQYELPELKPEGLNIIAVGSDSVVGRGSLKSPNYVKGLAGWSINSDGSAEFRSVTIAGILVATQGTFGGDGSDGALSIASGTTTIDLANAAVVIKNYTSISITGTGALAFSNPNANGTIVILKSQGNVTITSSTNPAIDLRTIGAARKTGSAQHGNSGNGIFFNSDGGNAGTSAGGVGGTGLNYSTISGFGNVLKIFTGSSGATGNTNSDTTTYGYGGAGGGALYIECAGALNGSSTINASGEAGGAGQTEIGSGTRYGGGGGGSNSNGSNGSSAVTTRGAGGGGGGGGVIIILYATLTSNTMTLTVTGGAGGASEAAGGAGSAGFSIVAENISNG